ncbi:MAG: hypothetical protein ISS52_04420 [Dehalococcoidia bacterium]|nr:hypothetical protein [Dehalococcoidia bacterium]
MKERVTLNRKEQKRLMVLNQVVAGRMGFMDAAVKRLGASRPIRVGDGLVCPIFLGGVGGGTLGRIWLATARQRGAKPPGRSLGFQEV